MNRPFRAGGPGGYVTQPFGLGWWNWAFSPENRPYFMAY